MRICMAADYEGMSRRAAAVMANQVRENPRSVLGLATGSSPVGMYAELSRLCRAGQITFRDVTTVNLDEYYGLTPDHEMSYRYFMEKNFFSLIDIPRENTHLPNGASLSPALECSRYDRLIESLGGIDLQLHPWAASICISSASATTATSDSMSPRTALSPTPIT